MLNIGPYDGTKISAMEQRFMQKDMAPLHKQYAYGLKTYSGNYDTLTEGQRRYLDTNMGGFFGERSVWIGKWAIVIIGIFMVMKYINWVLEKKDLISACVVFALLFGGFGLVTALVFTMQKDRAAMRRALDGRNYDIYEYVVEQKLWFDSHGYDGSQRYYLYLVVNSIHVEVKDAIYNSVKEGDTIKGLILHGNGTDYFAFVPNR